MELVITFALIVITAVIGFLVGRNSAPDQKKVTDMESLILEKDAELQNYRKKVTEHFDDTAQLFGKITDGYQTLFEHMANSSQELIGTQPFKTAIENNSVKSPQAKAIQSPSPKFNEEPVSLEDTFNNESLYKAHEYRNHEPESEPQATAGEAPPVVDTADIIQLEQAKSELDEKTKKSASHDKNIPLDYAIKEDGVVNHNSLDIEPKNN